MKIKELLFSKPILSLAFLFMIAAAIYYPSTSFEFLINFDDDTLILNSREYHTFNWESVKAVFSTTKDGLYHPITSLSWMVEEELFGLDPFYFHLDNLLFHLLNGLLVFVLIRRLFNQKVAFMVTLLFLIHPMHVSNVAWLSARKDLVVTAFMLLAMIFYDRYAEKRQIRSYLSVSLFLILALLSKTSAVVLPFLFLLVDWFKQSTHWGKRIGEKIPFFLLAFVILYVNLQAQSSAGFITDQSDQYSFIDRMLLISYSLAYYPFQLLFPVQLSPKNLYPIATGSLPIQYYLSVVFNGLLIALPVIIKKCRTVLLFSLLFYLFSIGPMLKIIPTGNDVVSNRYAYFAFLGLYTLIGYFLLKSRSKLLFGAAVIWVAFLAYKSYQYQFTYESSEEVWTAVIKGSAGNDWGQAMAYNERGQVKQKHGNREGSFADLQQSLQLSPNQPRALMNRANIYEQKGKLQLALADLNRAIEIAPKAVDALKIRGALYGKMNQPQKAIEDLNRAIELDPDASVLYNNRGIAYSILEEFEKAESDFNQAIDLDTLSTQYYVNRGNLYLSWGKLEKAESDFKLILNERENNFFVTYLLAKVKLEKGEVEKAKALLAPFAAEQEKAAQIGQRLLSDGYAKLSIEYFDIAIGIPDIREKSLYQRATAFRKTGEYQNAMDDLFALVETMPKGQFFFEIGNLYRLLNEDEKACQFWGEGAKRDHPGAKKMLAEKCD